MNFHALNEATIDGDVTHLGGGIFQLDITCFGKAEGVSGSASAGISIVAGGNFTQAPTGGSASIMISGAAIAKKAGRGISSAVAIISANGNLRAALHEHSTGLIVVKTCGNIHKTRLHFGYVWRNVSVVLARGNAATRHIKRNKAYGTIDLEGKVEITASIPATPAPAHASRYVMVQPDSRVMVIPQEKEQRGTHAAYSYVR